MPKSKTHWGYDLLTVALVALVSAFVFWAVPAQADAAFKAAPAVRAVA